VVPPFLADEAARLARAYAPDRWAAGVSSGPAEPWEAVPGRRIATDAVAVLPRAPRALAFPGTLTLQLELWRVPTLVLAAIDPLTYALGRRALAGRRLALPNLILGEDLFPEWVGLGPGPAPARFRSLWENLPGPEAMDWEEPLARIAASLGPGDGVRVAVEACLELLAGARLVTPVTSAR
jgi:hypothetical protein